MTIPTGWENSYKIDCVIDSSKFEASVIGYVVAVNFSESSGAGSRDLSGLFDLMTYADRKKCVFALSDGTRCVAECECWDDTNKIATYHVRLPIDPSDSDLTLAYYFNPAADDKTTRSIIEASDDFTGDDGDTPALEKWSIANSTNSVITIQSNKLNFSFSGVPVTAESPYVLLVPKIGYGNFIFSLDFSNLVTSNGNNTGLAIQLIYGNLNVITLFVRYQTYENSIIFGSNKKISGTWGAQTSVVTTYTTGALQIERSGTSVICRTKEGSGSFVLHQTYTSMSQDSLYVKLLYLNNVALSTVSCDIDNFSFGGADSISGFTDDTGSVTAQTVWPLNHVGVWHMSQSPAGGSGCILDSTSKANNGTPSGSMTVDDLILGPVGKAIEFDGNDSIKTIQAVGITGGSSRTLEVMLKTTKTTIERVIDYGAAVNYNEFGLTLNDSANNDYRIAITSGNKIWHDTITDGNWHYFAFILDGSTTGDIDGYLDGLAATVLSTNNQTLNTVDSPLVIGSNVAQAIYFFSGSISSVRLSNEALPAAWVKANYHNLTDALITFGVILTPYLISGQVQEGGANVARTVRAHKQSDGSLLGETISDEIDGSFEIGLLTDDECYVVAFDNESGDNFNALIFSGITPVPEAS